MVPTVMDADTGVPGPALARRDQGTIAKDNVGRVRQQQEQKQGQKARRARKSKARGAAAGRRRILGLGRGRYSQGKSQKKGAVRGLDKIPVGGARLTKFVLVKDL